MILFLACVQKPPPVLRPSPPPPPAPIVPVAAKGIWVGTVQTPSGPVPLRVEVRDQAAPVLVVQGQRLVGIGERTGNEVRWRVPALGATLRGTLTADRLTGSFEQMGRAVPLELVRQP